MRSQDQQHAKDIKEQLTGLGIPVFDTVEDLTKALLPPINEEKAYLKGILVAVKSLLTSGCTEERAQQIDREARSRLKRLDERESKHKTE